MRIQYADFTNVGARKNNEDALGFFENGDSFLAIVADGLGGHANGEIASKIAVDNISGSLLQKNVEEDELAYAILNANSAICRANITGHTTVAALWIDSTHAVAANLGDTRIYQFRDGKIIYQTTDHSIVQMAVFAGEVSPDAVRYHKDRNKLFRVLGVADEEPKVDSTELTIKPGDGFLICSDGFWEPVTEEYMLGAISKADSVQEWLNLMICAVESANNSKQDNYSAICILLD